MPSVTLTPTNMSFGFELGNQADGLVTSVAVLVEEKEGPQGVVYIRPKLPNWNNLQSGLKGEIYPDDPTLPPQRYIKEYTVSLDDRVYANIHTHPWWGPRYTMSLPFRPKKITVSMTLSTGGRYTLPIEIDENMPFDRTYDARTQENIKKPGDLVEDSLTTPYQDQVGTHVIFPSTACLNITVNSACAGSKAKGRIVHTSLILKKHPRFAPEGDRLLRETHYHQPIYVTGESVTMKARITPDMVNTMADVKLLARCETDKGHSFIKTFRHKMPDKSECRDWTKKAMIVTPPRSSRTK